MKLLVGYAASPSRLRTKTNRFGRMKYLILARFPLILGIAAAADGILGIIAWQLLSTALTSE